jgi:hypothetical protein
MEDTSYTLAWDKDICSWAVTDKGDLVPAITPERQEVINLLESDLRPWGTQEIADALCKNLSATSRLLSRLTETKAICKMAYGKWASTSFTVLQPLGESQSVKLSSGGLPETLTTLTIPRESKSVKVEKDTPKPRYTVPDLF